MEGKEKGKKESVECVVAAKLGRQDSSKPKPKLFYGSVWNRLGLGYKSEIDYSVVREQFDVFSTCFQIPNEENPSSTSPSPSTTSPSPSPSPSPVPIPYPIDQTHQKRSRESNSLTSSPSFSLIDQPHYKRPRWISQEQPYYLPSPSPFFQHLEFRPEDMWGERVEEEVGDNLGGREGEF